MFGVSNENILGSDLFYLIVTIKLSTTPKKNTHYIHMCEYICSPLYFTNWFKKQFGV